MEKVVFSFNECKVDLPNVKNIKTIVVGKTFIYIKDNWDIKVLTHDNVQMFSDLLTNQETDDLLNKITN